MLTPDVDEMHPAYTLAGGAVLVNGLLIHAVGVGLPSAYFASRVR